jgi:hypothetical protein
MSKSSLFLENFLKIVCYYTQQSDMHYLENPIMHIHKLNKTAVGADSSRPSPIYRPWWISRNPV